jgi:hypothetical protein
MKPGISAEKERDTEAGTLSGNVTFTYPGRETPALRNMTSAK